MTEWSDNVEIIQHGPALSGRGALTDRGPTGDTGVYILQGIKGGYRGVYTTGY